MNGTLFEGDIMLINKLAYGPRFPITPLTIPFTHQHLPFLEQTKSYTDDLSFDYHRIGGSPSVEYNDIIAFNYPYDRAHPIDHKMIFIPF
jgi:signal peptidase I